MSEDRPQLETRMDAAPPLLSIVLLLELAHVLVLAFHPRPLLASNVIQLLCSLTAVWVCLAKRSSLTSGASRRCMLAVGVAFTIWSGAQAFFLLRLCFPAYLSFPVRPDDVLWCLFGLPLLVAINTFSEEITDRVLWLDRLQEVVFFGVTYLAVWMPSSHLNLDTSFLIQDLVLLLSCLLRLSMASGQGERRFFVQLSLFLCLYMPMDTFANLLHRHGWQSGTLVDLAWTLPPTFFCCLILWDAIWSWNISSRDKMMDAVRSLQGLSAALLALLSIGISIFVALHQPVVGALCVALSFGLFAMRTNIRELAWQSAHSRLKQAIRQDALTGLANRTRLHDELVQRLALDGFNVVLFFVDLDHFKEINDSLGHALGDRVLIEVGQRLSAAAPAGSVVCRLGGDEFVVLSATPDAEHAQVAGENLLRSLQIPFLLGKHEIRCTASIGVVQAAGGESADDLLRTADHAMYRAKQVGRDRVQVFDADLYADLHHKRQMEGHLRICVAEKSIQVAFQPIYSVELGEICGFEALARWSHPVLGNVPPVEFITLAERSGLISALGAQILEKACAQMAAWNRTWRTSLSVSVNVSANQFSDASLMSSVLGVLERTGLPASLLRLEITETALLTNQEVVKQTLEEARSHGIRISLDDFGTGYSSLSFLLSLPVDEVKVDRSFVSHMIQDANRKELVRTVVHLGHTLGKRVVAEGVETEQDLLSLAEMGCECVQGYYISRPLSAEAIDADPPTFAIGAMAPQSADPSRVGGARTGSKRNSHAVSAHRAQYALPPELSEVVNPC